MLHTRIIPVLLLKNRGLYKGIQFKNHTYVGDPINTVKIFNDKEVDELVIFDIEASIKNKAIDFEYLEEVVSEAFMPIGYGGGIKTVDDARTLFALGIEKVVLNTQAFENPELITSIAGNFGSQSVVISLDVKKSLLGSYVYTLNGTKKTNYTLERAAKYVEQLGAGEIIINDIDKDGTRSGYNLQFVQSIANMVNIPIIVCGGARDITDFKKAKDAGAHACAAGAMFVYHGPHRAVLISYPDYKDLRTLLEE